MFQNFMSTRKSFKVLDTEKNKVVCYFIFYGHGNGHCIMYINYRVRTTDIAQILILFFVLFVLINGEFAK